MGRSVEKQVRWFWRFVMMPLMFGLVGASVNFKTIDKSIIPKAVAIIVSGQLPAVSILHLSSFLYHACNSQPNRCLCGYAQAREMKLARSPYVCCRPLRIGLHS